MNPRTPTEQSLTGGLYAFSAYLLWGVLPLYFLLLAPVGAFEIVAWRILLSLVFCALLIAVTRSWRRLAAILRQGRLVALTVLAGILIYVNWQTYLIGTLSGHVIETSLGYFINPIVTVLLGVIVLRERLRPTQWVAIGLATAAVVVIVVGYGAVPWIALILAFSFGFYGLVKKKIGPSVDAVSGLTLESLWLTPLAVVQLVVVAVTTGLGFASAGAGTTVALALAGVVTAVPLLLFAAGARRAPLTLLGIVQFVAPVLQFLIGWWVLGEPMTAGRWAGFALVWAALILLSADSIIASRRARKGAGLQNAPSDVADLT
ncbi:chloramphenicol-sensitive protein RarD [Microbacterium sp. SORGH_AS428]|uniref:EamA family transporter RarD n=1 Tax=Microbacterium sp. SORGH_AS_0428 TaxID=3041788 RepID=UPI002860FFAA|nr:EamA family transporter RarD [Microbacterium sp. SORGH_AS_0428]MDR6199230.1 chloramphenicol-sensitive protein RarD [Microbacterium sp. SORGH_AS_0428]